MFYNYEVGGMYSGMNKKINIKLRKSSFSACFYANNTLRQ